MKINILLTFLPHFILYYLISDCSSTQDAPPLTLLCKNIIKYNHITLVIYARIPPLFKKECGIKDLCYVSSLTAPLLRYRGHQTSQHGGFDGGDNSSRVSP